MGCYLHGLFAADGFRRAFLGRLRRRETAGIAYDALVEETLDALAAHLEAHLDLDRLLEVARGALSLGYDPLRRRPGSDGGGEHRHQRAGHPEDPDRAPHVIRRRGLAAVAEPGLVGRRFAFVVTGAQQGEAEGAGHRGFRPAGAGRAVPGGVAHHGVPRSPRRGTGDDDGRRRDQPPAMRAGTQFTASSIRAAARPKARWRGERWPIMLSIVLIAL